MAGQCRQSAQLRIACRRALPPLEPEHDGTHRHNQRSQDVHEALDTPQQDGHPTTATRYGFDGDDPFSQRSGRVSEGDGRIEPVIETSLPSLATCPTLVTP